MFLSHALRLPRSRLHSIKHHSSIYHALSTLPPSPGPIDWQCKATWRSASVNTAWCLLGCSIGEFGTLFAFQAYYGGAFSPTMFTIVTPVVNGLATSILLETLLLRYGSTQMPMKAAFHTATGMSFISMCMMEFAMELSGKFFRFNTVVNQSLQTFA